jgi:integrase
VKGARRLGVRIGNWLTAEEGRRLIAAFDASTPKQRRNRALIALLIGCGLRRAEALKLEDIQLREEHWVIADLRGKGGHIRTVPMPHWMKKAIDDWALPIGITSGPLFKAINNAGRAWGNGFTPKVISSIVKEAATGCEISGLAPHDLRSYAECRIMPNRWARLFSRGNGPGARLAAIRHNNLD